MASSAIAPAKSGFIQGGDAPNTVSYKQEKARFRLKRRRRFITKKGVLRRISVERTV